MLNMCSFPKAIVKKRNLLRNPSPFKRMSRNRHAVFWPQSLVHNDSSIVNLVRASHKRITLMFSTPKEIKPFFE